MSKATYSNILVQLARNTPQNLIIQSQSHNHINFATPAKLPWSLHLAEQDVMCLIAILDKLLHNMCQQHPVTQWLGLYSQHPETCHYCIWLVINTHFEVYKYKLLAEPPNIFTLACLPWANTSSGCRLELKTTCSDGIVNVNLSDSCTCFLANNEQLMSARWYNIIIRSECSNVYFSGPNIFTIGALL